MEFEDWVFAFGIGILGAFILIMIEKTDLEYYLIGIAALAVLFGGWSKL